MKKFLVYLSVIVVAIALGFTIFQLVKDDEVISLSATSVYTNVGEEFQIEVNYKNKKSYTKVEKVIVNNASIVSVIDESDCKFVAKTGGYTQIVVKTNNTKFRNLNCDVYIGEGTLINPFYIYSAKQLMQIGVSLGEDSEGNDIIPYPADKNYKLMADIDLSTADDYGYWLPIAYDVAGGFTGRLDGNGFTLYNLKVNMDLYNEVRKDNNITSVETVDNVGLISTIGVGGKVQNLRLQNVDINGNYAYAGAIAGINNGTIERSQVASLIVNGINGNAVIGGIAGANIQGNAVVSGEIGDSLTGSSANGTSVARIDRCSVTGANFGRQVISVADGNVAYDTTVVSDGYIKGLKGAYIGGLTGINGGGIVIYSYTSGTIQLNAKFGDDLNTTNNTEGGYFGGLVGYNTYFVFDGDSANKQKWRGGNIKDCYADVDILPVLLDGQLATAISTIYSNAHVGKVAGHSDLSQSYTLEVTGTVKLVNRIYGVYYTTDSVGTFPAFGEGTIPDSTITFNANGTVDTSNETAYKYVVGGMTRAELSKASNLYSYIDSDDQAVEWKFNQVWYKSSNGGLPYLDYSLNTAVTDDLYTILDAGEIKTIDALKDIDMDGYYFLASDLVLPEDWAGLGTEDSPFIGHFYGNYYMVDGEKVYYTISATDNIKKPLFNYIGEGALVKDVYLKDMTVDAVSNPCGILSNENYGTIIDCVISNCTLNANTANISNSTTVIAGTFTGYNSGSISNCQANSVKVDVHYSPEGETTNNLSTTAYVGGIAGQNDNGSISTCNVFTKSGIGIQNSISSALVGGVVGTTTGRITDCYVYAPLTTSMSNSDAYVGGIAGSVSGNLSVSATDAGQNEYNVNGKRVLAHVSNCGYTGGGISGYNAGGVIGVLSMTNLGDRIIDIATMDLSNDVTFTSDSRWPNDVEKVYASSTKGAIEGTYIGGLVSKITNGVVANSYADIQLTGKNSGDTTAVVGGLASVLKWKDSDGVHFDGGIIEKCYTNCTFKGEGTMYALSSGEIRTVSLKAFFTAGVSTGKTDGLAKNCVYNSDNGGILPSGQNGLQNFFSDFQDNWNKWFNTNTKWNEVLVADLNKIKSTTTEMYGSAIFDTNGFDKVYTWFTSDNAMPKLIGLKYLVISADGQISENADGSYNMTSAS